jgi:hypothetical protein
VSSGDVYEWIKGKGMTMQRKLRKTRDKRDGGRCRERREEEKEDRLRKGGGGGRGFNPKGALPKKSL